MKRALVIASGLVWLVGRASTFADSYRLRVVGSVLIPAGGEVELSFDVPTRSTRMVVPMRD